MYMNAVQEESMKFERVNGTERNLMKKYILMELGTLVSKSSRGNDRVVEADAVLFDIYGYSDLMKRLGKCYQFRQAAALLEDTGIGELFALCNSPQLFSTVKELIDIRCRLKDIQKANRKGGKSSYRKEEQEYLTELYKSATKVFRKKLGLKKANKNRYRTRYGGISALIDDNETKGWSLFEDDYMEDEDDYGFSSSDFSNYMNFAKRNGYKSGINKIVGGSVATSPRRSTRFDDDEDEEESYDLFEERPRHRASTKRSNLSLYPDEEYDDEDEYEEDPRPSRSSRKEDQWRDSIETRIDRLTDAIQAVLVKTQVSNPSLRPTSRLDPMWMEPQDPNDPIRKIEELRGKVDQLDMLMQTNHRVPQTDLQTKSPDELNQQIYQLTNLVNQLSGQLQQQRQEEASMSRRQTYYESEEVRGPRRMTLEEYEDQKIRHSQSIVNDDDDDDDSELYTPEEKAMMMNFSPMFSAKEEKPAHVAAEENFQRRVANQNPGRVAKAPVKIVGNFDYTDKMNERAIFEADDDDEDDEPLTMEEIEILANRMDPQEVQMLMRSELTPDEQEELYARHPEYRGQKSAPHVVEATADPVPGNPMEEIPDLSEE